MAMNNVIILSLDCRARTAMIKNQSDIIPQNISVFICLRE